MAATANAREVIGEATLGELESTLRGELVRPSDPDYDQARLVWNAAHDRRPALIIRCAGTADVMRAVEFARSEGLQLAVRSGAHSVAGFSTCDGGVVIDISSMKGIQVDPIAPAGGRAGRAHLGRVRPRDAGVRPGRHRRPGIEHRHRRVHPRRRDRLAVARVRAHL